LITCARYLAAKKKKEMKVHAVLCATVPRPTSPTWPAAKPSFRIQILAENDSNGSKIGM
jgi:hypothetical protein